MRVVFAECSVDYSGRLDAYLPKAPRLIMMKADGSVLIHSDGGSYKPLNWMSAPCTLTEAEVSEEEAEAGVKEIWLVANNKTNDALNIRVFEILGEMEQELGQDPGLVKDGVEAHLQELLAEQVDLVGSGTRLIRREFPTAIGPVDLMVKDSDGKHVAIEIKRRGEIDGVEQLTRYLELLNRDPLLAPVAGIFAAQEIKPQARVLAEDRGIRCLVLDYGAMKGTDNVEDRLF